MKTIYLVACVAQKVQVPLPAAELYTSDWFRKARSYVKSQIEGKKEDRWFILSAKHHLLDPCKQITPYNETLNEMPKSERSRWSDQVCCDLLQKTNADDRIVILAGARYRDSLEFCLQKRGYTVEVPMAGLR